MSSNALAVYQKLSDPMQFITTMGRDYALSGTFGKISESVGRMLALECLVRGITPIALAEEYDVIQGRLSRKAAACLRNFLKSGGTIKQVARTPDHAEIEFVSPSGDKQVYRLTWEAAQHEPFPYEGKESDVVKALAEWNGGKGKGKRPELKPKYATDHSRMQMLWSRVVKDAVKAMTGDGMDTSGDPEDDDLDSVPEAAKTNGSTAHGDAVDADYEVKPEAKSELKPAEPTKPADTSLEFPPAETGEKSTAPAPEDLGGEKDGYSTAAQRDEIAGHFNMLGVTHAQREAVLAKRGVTSLRSLTFEQADELLTGLRNKVATMRANFLAGSSKLDPAATSMANDGPCTQAQIDKVKELLPEVEQTHPGTNEKLKQKLNALGRPLGPDGKLLSSLTHDECLELIKALERKEMEGFFARSLQSKPAAQ
jgi:hypothetical protein